MSVSQNRLRNHLPFILFFILFVVVGISIYQDYGISWDEPISRYNNGILNINFINTGDYEPIITGAEKYHGPIFEIFLVGLERMFELTDSQDIYFMRHLVTFFVFALSVLFFYLLCIKHLKSRWLATLGAIFLVLSPRIFAESFYNYKDLVFMSFFVINIFTSLLFLERRSFTTAVFHALISAIVIDIRILGIIIPCFTLLIFFIEFIRFPKHRKKIVIINTIFLLFLVALIILFWPVLWRNPIDNFFLALSEMSKYPWDGNILYLGENYSAANLPWHYIPVWILISTPLLYSILFIVGIIFIFKRIFQRIQISIFAYFNLYIFLFPLVAIISLQSVVYDGWRHMYFIYPSFLLISLFGMDNLISMWQNNKTIISIAKTGLIIYCFFIGFQMINLHPYQNVYFNIIAGKSLKECRTRFEVDYWGLSYKEGINYILEKDSSSNIFVCGAEGVPADNNFKIFSEADRRRISFTDVIELADYYISGYRFHNSPYLRTSDFDVIRDKGIILSVFDLRKSNEEIINSANRICNFQNNYESAIDNWYNGKIVLDSLANSGVYIEFVDSLSEFGTSFNYTVPPELVNDTTLKSYLEYYFQIKSPFKFNTYVVLEIESSSGKIYDWKSNSIQYNLKNQWSKFSCRFPLPNFHTSKDIIKVYFWNTNRNLFYLDDIEVNIYSVPTMKVRKAQKDFL